MSYKLNNKTSNLNPALQSMQDSDLNLQNSFNMFQQQADGLIGATNNKLASSAMTSTKGIKIKPIGSALAEDATRVKKLTDATGVANKAVSATKLANGMNAASMLTDPLLQAGEGIATSLGATFAEKDTISGAVDAISGVASMFGPAGQAIGIGLKALDFVDRAAGKNVKGFQGNTGLSAYSDFSTQGNKFRATQRGKAKGLEASKAEGQQFYGNAMNIKNQQGQVLAGANSFNTGTANQSKLKNNFNSSVMLSKQGSKLERLKDFKSKKKSLSDPQGSITANNAKDFESGGFKVNLKTDEVKLAQHGSVVDGSETIGKEGMEITEKNVIPSGALHAHKHNLLDEGGEMTTKGIPVITVAKEGDILDEETEEKAKGGEIIQHAEIEKEEIILTLTLTQKIEEFRKDGSKKAMIKAGELLAKEIMENTEDNTGLIEKLTDNEN